MWDAIDALYIPHPILFWSILTAMALPISVIISLGINMILGPALDKLCDLVRKNAD